MSAIILFDGVCNFCNRSVQFIIKRDPKGYFLFASQQSEAGKRLMEKYNIESDMKSIVLIEEDQFYQKSSAAIRICRHLSGVWKIGSIFNVIPRPFRDALYDIVARNRYKWFGRSDTCMLPSIDIKERFLQ